MNSEIEYINQYLIKNIYKILKVNLTNDSYEIIRANDNELSSDKGYDQASLSGWLEKFVASGQIYQEDIINFTLHADVNFLKRFFMFSDGPFRIRYRRVVDSDYRWVMMEVVPAAEYTPDNQIVILTIQDVDDDIVEMLEAARREQVMAQLKDQYDTIKSIASIYASLHIINLVDNTSVEFSADSNFHEYYANAAEKATDKIQLAIRRTITSDDLDKALKFTDLTTLSDRLSGTQVISDEFIDVNVGWCRFQFIANSRSADGALETVIYAVQVIEQQKRHEENLIRMSNTDELTRVYNRRSYENDSAKYKESPLEDDLIVILMDLNGLKQVNDTIGHAAGDEIITAAARCMLSAFGSLGRIYRTGGDEFAAIVHYDPTKENELKTSLDTITARWHGVLVDSLHIAYGSASHKGNPEASFEELEHIADKAMYEDKNRYYTENNIDRRVY